MTDIATEQECRVRALDIATRLAEQNARLLEQVQALNEELEASRRRVSTAELERDKLRISDERIWPALEHATGGRMIRWGVYSVDDVRRLIDEHIQAKVNEARAPATVDAAGE